MNLLHFLFHFILPWLSATIVVLFFNDADATISTYYTVSTAAGNGINTYSGDNGTATSAGINAPWAVFLDSSNNLYIAEYYGHRIRKVNGLTNIITTIAGTGVGGYSGDNGFATNVRLYYPAGVWADSTGNVFIADTFNGLIRKVSAESNIITTVAGTGSLGYGGDNGPATSAQIYAIRGIWGDKHGNLFIPDGANSRVRKVDGTSNIISTIAGNGTYGHGGDNGPATSAQVYNPYSVWVDSNENVFIADSSDHRIRKIDGKTNIITTFAGNGRQGQTGDNGPATSATLFYPNGVWGDSLGNIFITKQSTFISA